MVEVYPRSHTGGTRPKFFVALSGGGYRATAFASGALLYLCDSNLLKNVTVVSSVSGGSITNGFLAAREGPPSDRSTEETRIALFELLSLVAKRNVFWPDLRTAVQMYVVPFSWGIGTAALVAMSWPASQWWIRASLMLSVLLTADLVLRSRARATTISLERIFSLFQEGTSEETPDEGIEHIFCATDLSSGSPAFIRRGQIYAGAGPWLAIRWSLAQAVAASAAYPLVFAPVRVRAWGTSTRRYVLADGGVSNNLGSQWLSALAARRGNALVSRRGDLADTEIIVDASVPPKAIAAWVDRVPMSELLYLARVMDVLFRNTLQPRQFELQQRASTAGNSPTAVHVWLQYEPIAAVRARLAMFEAGPGQSPFQVSALRECLTLMENAERQVTDCRTTSLRTGTNLTPLGPIVAARIALHGYVSMMSAACGRVTGARVLPIASIDEFAEMLSD